jgi:hypothetical protein
VEPFAGYRIKLYSISADGAPISWPAFADGLRLALGALPRPAVTPERPGVGFVIAHKGRGDYAVLAWWDRENELPLRVFVRPVGAGARWRPARESESVCVWDLEVVAHERDAYVETVLGPGAHDKVRAYLDRALGEAAATGGILSALRLE